MRVEWSDFAWEMLSQTSDNILYQFGLNSYLTFLNDVDAAVGEIREYPTIAPVEKLLEDRPFEYRGLVVRSLNKIIYTIDEEHDTIYITDFWDTRREPQVLAASV